MDISYLLDPLNDAQRAAVTAPSGPVLVLAGAGSGKTRVLVHRIAWMVRVGDVSPYSVLAVTFTNKAAAEMRGRLEQLLAVPAAGLWVGTFHGIAHRLLRAHWREANLPQSFQILDNDDQYRLVRRVLKTMALDEAKWPPRQAQWYINARKDEGLRVSQVRDEDGLFERQMRQIYHVYEETCQRLGVVDFAELLLRAYELWRQCPDLLAHYQQRFKHVLVDEFQDTNPLQYAWLRLLAGAHNSLFMVGDDDQSIYGWRGARIENMQHFSRDFPGATVLRLEQNYRSTKTILAAANAVIAHNSDRLGKTLWTAGAEGEPILLYSAFNDFDEARFVVERIRQWVDDGQRRDAAAILYRSNAQSRLFEEALLAAGMPYRVYGGLRFFDRAEIKDALAYLRLIANHEDDAAFERVANVPARGIGERSIEVLREHARQQQISLWQAARAVLATDKLAARAASSVGGFLGLIERLSEAVNGLSLGDATAQAVEGSGLLAQYRKHKGEKGLARAENLEELITAARQFSPDETQEMEPLQAFLAHAVLEAGEGQGAEWDDCVQLMTLHSAKGLEFPLVFMCGMEDGLFPHQMSSNDEQRLAEERRLCYVGMTRAQRLLYFTCAERRRLHGTETFGRKSRFLEEIPRDLLREVRLRGTVTRPLSGRASYVVAEHDEEDHAAPLRLGQRVRHATFGDGVILDCKGSGSQAAVQVNFEGAGAKWLVLAYAKLQTL